MMTFILGIMVLLNNSWSAVLFYVILIVFLWNKAAKEESIFLEQEEEMKYFSYKQKVGGRLAPFLDVPFDFVLQQSPSTEKKD
jgi:protein-S-isoprenylcysteine O-methyltransferase Ste14